MFKLYFWQETESGTGLVFYFFLPNNICVVIRGETDKKQGDIHVKLFACMR